MPRTLQELEQGRRAERVRVKGYTGEVVYIYAYDIAYDMRREPIGQLLGQPIAHFSVDSSKRAPRQMFFYRPQMVRLPPVEGEGPYGKLRIERVVKLLPAGAISITARVPFEVSDLGDLVVYHDLQIGGGSLQAEMRRLADEIREELLPVLIRPIADLAEEEAYTVFCLEAPLLDLEGHPIKAGVWLEENRRQIAALLTQESDIDHLSDQEALESTHRHLSYYENDLIVVDWDAALIVDEPSDFEESLYVMELANLQLAELEAYDRILDGVLERSYRDALSKSIGRRTNVLGVLRDLRIDLARFNDELSNITKFFGDWHLARLYENLAARFHLGDWHRTVNEKLKTLDDLYQLLKHDQTNRWMLILEATIVLLFIIDLAVLFTGR